jgi:hypothetical protein
MNHHGAEKMIPIVRDRLSKGGRIKRLWLVFRKNHLDGIFQITGDNQKCILELSQGAVVKFSFEDQQGNWSGKEALSRLKDLVRKSGVRFSIFVTP